MGGAPKRSGQAAGNPEPATVLLGVGIGGFFDGIVLHQVLGWHHLLSAHIAADTVGGLRLNTLADGLFHAAAWIVTVAGILLLYRHARRAVLLPWRGLVGGLLTGWGTFNVAEGLVDHHLLGLHHVRPGPDQLLYDVGFLVWGVVMAAVGVLLVRSGAAARSGRT